MIDRARPKNKSRLALFRPIRWATALLRRHGRGLPRQRSPTRRDGCRHQKPLRANVDDDPASAQPCSTKARSAAARVAHHSNAARFTKSKIPVISGLVSSYLRPDAGRPFIESALRSPPLGIARRFPPRGGRARKRTCTGIKPSNVKIKPALLVERHRLRHREARRARGPPPPPPPLPDDHGTPPT